MGAVTPAIQQTALSRPIPLGTSGGNINSLIKSKKGKVTGCFSGTLGSMVQDSNDIQYVLSNNHVIANQNKAKPGQLIVQPGLVDVECVGLEQCGRSAQSQGQTQVRRRQEHC